MTNRHDALALLGLVGTGSVALATENFVEPAAGNHVAAGNDWNGEKAATALRKLADGIAAGTVDVDNLSVNSTLSSNEIVTQTLILNFRLPESFS